MRRMSLSVLCCGVWVHCCQKIVSLAGLLVRMLGYKNCCKSNRRAMFAFCPRIKNRRKWIYLPVVLTLALGGCSMSTTVFDNHPLLTEPGSDAATVYLIRSQTERRMGISDNALIVDFNGEQALSLEKGEYVVLNVVPRDYTIILKNRTEVGPRWDVKWMSKKYKFSFKADKTYYIETKSIDGEFRGVFFVAKDMARHQAKQLAQLQNLRAAGTLAKQSPL